MHDDSSCVKATLSLARLGGCMGSWDPAEDHFELRFGSVEDFDWNAWVLVARVGRPLERESGVECIIDPADPESAPMSWQRHLHGRLFGDMLRRIWARPMPAGGKS